MDGWMGGEQKNILFLVACHLDTTFSKRRQEQKPHNFAESESSRCNPDERKEKVSGDRETDEKSVRFL